MCIRDSYKIVYKTNLSGSEYRVLADSLNTQQNYCLLYTSPAGTPAQKMEDTIVKALELYRKRERAMER